MVSAVELFVRNRLNAIGYDVEFDDNHQSSPLEAQFKRTINELLNFEGFFNIYSFEEALIFPAGSSNLNDVSPYDFLIVYNDQIALIEIDGAYHFFHQTNSSAIVLDERRKHRRIAIDREKIKFSFDSGISMLRIAYNDMGEVKEILRTFLDEMFFSKSTVVMYSNESIYKHLIPTSDSFVRSGCICFYDDIIANGIDRMEVSRPHFIDYEYLSDREIPMFVNKSGEIKKEEWMKARPVKQDAIY